MAERELRRIRRGNPSAHRRLGEAIRALARDPRPPGCVQLSGIDPPAWRIRVADYRVVYEVHDRELVVIVIRVAPRGEVYR